MARGTEIVEFLLRIKDEASASLSSVRSEAEGTTEATDGLTAANAKAIPRMAGLAGAAVAVAASMAAVGKAMFDTANAASELVDKFALTAAQTGLTAQQVVGLDKAARAAGLNGVQALQTGLASLTRTVTMAQQGSTEAAEKLAMLGLSAEEMNLAEPNEMLRQVADGLAQMPSEGEKAAAAIQLFGARGARLTAVLGHGADALDEYADKAARAGLVMSGETLAASAAMDAAMTDLNIAIEAATLQMGTAFIPIFREAADVLARVTPITVQIARIIAEDFTLGLRFAIAVVVEFAKTVGERFGAIGKVFQAFKTGSVRNIVDSLNNLDEVLRSPVRAFTDMAGAIKRAVDETAKFRQAREEMKALSADAGGLGAALGGSGGGGAPSVAEGAQKAAESVKGLGEVLAATDFSTLGRVTPGASAESLNAIVEQGRTSAATQQAAGEAPAVQLTADSVASLANMTGAALAGNLTPALMAIAPVLGEKIGGAAGGILSGLLSAIPKLITGTGRAQVAAEEERSAINQQIAELTREANQLQRAGDAEAAAAVKEQISELRAQRAEIKSGAEQTADKLAGSLEAVIAGIFALPEALVLGLTGLIENIGDIGARFGEFLTTKLDDVIIGLARIPIEIVKALVRLPFEFFKAIGRWWSDIGGFVGLGHAVFEGIADWFAGVWDSIKNFFQKVFTGGLGGEEGLFNKIGGFFKDVGEFVATGDTARDHYPKGGYVTRDGLAFVEAGERIVRTNGEDGGTGRAMGTQTGGGNVYVTVNGYVEESVLDRMVRELERAYGADGRRSSDLFAVG
jgi:hypothetical protein